MSRGKGSNVADAAEVGEDNIAGADNDLCERDTEVHQSVGTIAQDCPRRTALT